MKIVKKKEIRDALKKINEIKSSVAISKPKYGLIDKIRNKMPWNKKRENL